MRTIFPTFILSTCKVLIALTLLTNVAAAAPHESSQEGTSSSGGGDVPAEQRLPYWHMKSELDRIRGLLPYIFRHIEVMATFSDPKSTDPIGVLFRSINHKLFTGATGRTVYDALKIANIELRETGPCTGPSGQDVDGSAYSVSGDVCLSYERLQPKLSIGNIYSKLTALLVHEATHLAGGTEDESLLLQSTTELNIAGPAFFYFEDAKNALLEKVDSAITQANDLATSLQGLEDSFTCLELPALSAKLDELQHVLSLGSHDFYRFLSYRKSIQVAQAYLKSFQLNYYCIPTNAKGRESYDRLFAGKQEMPLRDLISGADQSGKSDGDVGMMFDKSITMSHVGYHDKKHASIELNQITRELEAIHNELKQIQFKW